jgi:hypothetical protein
MSVVQQDRRTLNPIATQSKIYSPGKVKP